MKDRVIDLKFISGYAVGHYQYNSFATYAIIKNFCCGIVTWTVLLM